MNTIDFLFCVLLLTLALPRHSFADNIYISFSPAIYITDNPVPSAAPGVANLQPPQPSEASQPAASPPASYNPFNNPALSSISTFSSPPSDDTPPQPYNNNPFTPSLPSPPQSFPSLGAYIPATALSTVSCDTIGEPSWLCNVTQRCAFDDNGDISCYPVGEFCKGTVNYGESAGSIAEGRPVEAGYEGMSGQRRGSRSVVMVPLVMVLIGELWF